MGGLFRIFLVAVIVLAISGCASANNILCDGPKPCFQRVYGGVKWDVADLKSTFRDLEDGPNDSLELFTRSWEATLLTVDLPLSAVADTLTLPITVPLTISRKSDATRAPSTLTD
jgi:uncharacterized protein YceK